MSVLSKTTAAAVVFLAMVGVAQADSPSAKEGFSAGDILIRGRFVSVLPDVRSNVPGLAGYKAEISDDYIPELDFTYFATDNIGIELIAGTSRHKVLLNDEDTKLQLGKVRLLPPTVTVDWHFSPKSEINPYVGAGLNYTLFYGGKDLASGVENSIKYNNSVGYALHAGADYHITGNWYANVDVKKIFLSTRADVHAGALHTIARVNIDPWLVGTGIGYRF